MRALRMVDQCVFALRFLQEFLRRNGSKKLVLVRINWYVKGLHEHDHPHCYRVQEICDHVLETELQLIHSHPRWMVQSHGDFHLKNILFHNDGGTHCFSVTEGLTKR